MPTFFDAQIVTEWITPAIQPFSRVQPACFDDERISVPLTDRISIPERTNVLWNLSAIRPDLTPVVSPFEHLEHLVRQLNEADPVYAINQRAQQAGRIRIADRIICFCRNNGSWPKRGLVRPHLRQPFRCHGREFAGPLTYGGVATSAAGYQPHSAQVMRVMWRTRYGSIASPRTCPLARLSKSHRRKKHHCQHGYGESTDDGIPHFSTPLTGSVLRSAALLLFLESRCRSFVRGRWFWKLFPIKGPRTRNTLTHGCARTGWMHANRDLVAGFELTIVPALPDHDTRAAHLKPPTHSVSLIIGDGQIQLGMRVLPREFQYGPCHRDPPVLIIRNAGSV